jgi:hypothetical protein
VSLRQSCLRLYRLLTSPRLIFVQIIKSKPDYSVLLKPSFWKGALSTSTKQVRCCCSVVSL